MKEKERERERDRGEKFDKNFVMCLLTIRKI